MNTATELGEQICTKCHGSKEATEFYANLFFLKNMNKAKRNKMVGWCKSCIKIWSVSQGRKKRCGISAQDYDTMMEDQDYCCALCGKSELEQMRELSVDHDHHTGKVRGLLCTNCNVGLGHFKDDPTLLQKAILYLTQS